MHFRLLGFAGQTRDNAGQPEAWWSHPMQDYRKRIEKLTGYLAAVDRRLAEHEAAAAKTTQPLSRHFTEKIEEARRERTRLAEHIRELSREDAAHWNTIEPVGGGLLHGLLTACDQIGERIEAALGHIEKR